MSRDVTYYTDKNKHDVIGASQRNKDVIGVTYYTDKNKQYVIGASQRNKDVIGASD